jgi:hypothetical protein
MKWLAPLLLLLCSAGCAEDVSGHWCGKLVGKERDCRGDDVGYLTLRMNEATIEGQACEAHDHDCHLIEKGLLDGQQVKFHYKFSGGYVDAKLVVKGDVMQGKLYASKCSCDVPFTFHRIR